MATQLARLPLLHTAPGSSLAGAGWRAVRFPGSGLLAAAALHTA